MKATCTAFRTGSVPGAPRACRGPRRAENRPKIRGRIYLLFLPKVRPAAVQNRKTRWTHVEELPFQVLGPTCACEILVTLATKCCFHKDQRYPEVVFWPSGLLEAWGTKANKPHISLKLMVCWPCRRRPQGQQTTMFCERREKPAQQPKIITGHTSKSCRYGSFVASTRMCL